jgi:hypothetical protein
MRKGWQMDFDKQKQSERGQQIANRMSKKHSGAETEPKRSVDWNKLNEGWHSQAAERRHREREDRQEWEK